MIWIVLSLFMWLGGTIVLMRIRELPASQPDRPVPTISVIIPARNEEHNLPRLLKSLRAQSIHPLEVMVVDDHSTDDTVELAGQLGATVLSAPPLPEGWLGKPWACQHGAKTAKGEWLLFLDADTWLEPDGLRRIATSFTGGALSVGPYHAVQRCYEQLSVFFNINMVAGTVPNGLFGQMLLIDCTTYFQVGGHERVKDQVLENLFLAEIIRKPGIKAQSFSGRGVLSFRMYPHGLAELVAGWRKGFASGAARTPMWRLLGLIAWLSSLMTPFTVMLTMGHPWLATALYLMLAYHVAVVSHKVGSFHWLVALVYPIPLFFFFAVFASSKVMSKQSLTWKGRPLAA